MSHKLPLQIAALLLIAGLAAPATAKQSLLLRDQEQIRVEFADPATGNIRVDTFIVKYFAWIGEQAPGVAKLEKGSGCRTATNTWIERRFYLKHPLTGEQSINSKYSRTLVSAGRGNNDSAPCGESHKLSQARLAEVFPRMIAEDRARLVKQLEDELEVVSVRLVG